MAIRRASMITAALLASACGGGSPDRPPPASSAELDAYCAVAQRSELDVWVGSVLTLCATSSDEESVACTAARGVVESGAVTAIDLRELSILRALPASGGRLVALLADERLVVLDAEGEIERELASWASDPWVSEDGARVVWVGLPEGVDRWDFGVPTVIAGQGLDETARTVLVDDVEAATPRPIPGTRDVLFVSTSTGLASFWVASPGRAPVQITNVGLDEIVPGFTPVMERQLAWADGVLFYGVAEEDGSSRVWRLDVAARAATEVGPGEWPRIARTGSVLALLPSGASTCAASYPAGGTP
ncbi:MAG: hypothetical protein M3Y87_17510 [Myxococcota bacterium]|nr:hypothetical protein [Myxococcota bacterium]